MTVDRLWLYWELDGTPMSDDYHGWEISAFDLFDKWFDRYCHKPWEKPMRIYWFVMGDHTCEFAHLTPDDRADSPHWSKYFTEPLLMPTLEPVEIGDLPMRTGHWTPERYTKGGFVQEATGWHPYPLQGWVTPELLARNMRRNFHNKIKSGQAR